MFEPLKYGVPFGFLAVIMLSVQVSFGTPDWTILRWVLSSSFSVLGSLLIYRKVGALDFSFRVACFCGFNVLIASNLVYAVLIYTLSDFIFNDASLDAFPQVLYVVFMEFISQMTIGLLILSAGAFALKR